MFSRRGRGARLGDRANRAVGGFVGRVDGRTEEVAARVATSLVGAGRLLRTPSLVLLVVPLPFVLLTGAVALGAEGPARVVGLLVTAAMLAVSAGFGLRRVRLLRAVEDRDRLETELGLLIAMSGRVDETRGILEQLAGGGGVRALSRLRGAWRTTSLPGTWIEGVGDLPRARYFAPPRLGTTVTLTVAALWLVPISVLVALFAVIGGLAGSL